MKNKHEDISNLIPFLVGILNTYDTLSLGKFWAHIVAISVHCKSAVENW